MKRNYIAIGVGLPITLILAISIMIHASWVSHFDHFFEQVVHTVPNLQGLMLKITFLASPKMDLVWMLIIAIILWIKHQRPLSLNIFVLLLSTDGLGWIIKHVVRRARPMQHLAIDNGYSFPSGHVLGMSIIVLWLILVLFPLIIKNKTTRTWIDVLLVVWLIIVMISRVYVYAHYQSDVCGSVAVALLWLGILEWIWTIVTPKTKKNTF